VFLIHFLLSLQLIPEAGNSGHLYAFAGRNAVPGRSDPVPTDPFMMLVTAEARFDADTGFATASFCEIQNNVQVCSLSL